jgi:hypothetical protein
LAAMPPKSLPFLGQEGFIMSKIQDINTIRFNINNYSKRLNGGRYFISLAEARDLYESYGDIDAAIAAFERHNGDINAALSALRAKICEWCGGEGWHWECYDKYSC